MNDLSKSITMKTEEDFLRIKIMAELLKQFPDLKPKVASITGKQFVYELERHDNYTYYSVGYTFDKAGNLIVNWESAELTII